MKTAAIIEGLQILEKYHDDSGYNCSTDHDIIYGYVTDRLLEADDLNRMIELGWFQFDEVDLTPENYDPEEAWAAYT